MKKLSLILMVLSATCSALAGSYFTTGVNDTLLINPSAINFYYGVKIGAHFESRFDNWRLTVDVPDAMESQRLEYGPGMTVPYKNSNGNDTVYTATITTSTENTVLSSLIPVFGYWDFNNDEIYEPYGTVKWGPADYDEMFTLFYWVYNDCTGDSIVLTGEMTSTMDWRGGTGNEMFHKVIRIVFGYHLGDVDGDGTIDLGDVTTVVAYILGDITLDQYKIAAADMNHDGEVDAGDVTLLIAYINSH